MRLATFRNILEGSTLMRNFFIGLGMLMLLSACSSAGLPAYQPEALDVPLETWQEKYPLEYDDWQASVHGQAYLAGDTNAPACTDCHSDPENEEMRTAAFRLDIPNRCARCHADESVMSQYEISSDAYDTYLADYHGTTIQYYRAVAPSTWRYEAVCSDCHSSHAIYPAEDERSTVAPINLTTTCQRCHHDASYSFTSAYGHYRPIRSPVAPQDTVLVFIVKLIYQAMIPVTLGMMVAYIGIDIRHRLRNRPKVKDAGEDRPPIQPEAKDGSHEK
jgi:5-methylcytosine-specific restriction endonuclease McrA